MMWYWGSGMGLGWGGWIVMGIAMIIFWALVIWGIVALVRYLTSPDRQVIQPGAGRMATTPESILAERFARGEIDEEEYRRRLAVLKSP